jgi:hypothetical protein
VSLDPAAHRGPWRSRPAVRHADRVPRRPAAAVLLAAGLALAGCGSGVVRAAQVADAAEDSLAKQVGQRPAVTCRHDLAAEVGATTRCTLTARGLAGTYGVTVTVTAVDGGRARFDVRVDPAPLG